VNFMGKYQLFVCKVCGDPYLGTDAPSMCPFCGAHSENVVPANTWEPLWGKPVQDVSTANLEVALKLEVGAVNFYKNVMDASDDVGVKKLFKAIMKAEREHASTIVKLMDTKMPDLKSWETEADKARDTLEENLLETRRREENAVSVYDKAALNSEDEHVKYFFREISKVEADHILLTE